MDDEDLELRNALYEGAHVWTISAVRNGEPEVSIPKLVRAEMCRTFGHLMETSELLHMETNEQGHTMTVAVLPVELLDHLVDLAVGAPDDRVVN